MSLSIIISVLTLIAFVVFRLLSRTDTPKIKDLPEIPGVPVFGNLLQFGANHAKVAQQLSKKWGPAFQVRFGNKVSVYNSFQRCR